MLLLVFLLAAGRICPQTVADTGILYIHNEKNSCKSKLVQAVLGVAGVKTRSARIMKKERFHHQAAPVKPSLKKNFIVDENFLNGRKIWVISPVVKRSDRVILYIHGGAYVSNLVRFHWDLIEQLLISTGAVVVLPDYPLAPEAVYTDVHAFILTLYLQLAASHNPGDIIIMGDSAGGGFALGFAMTLKNENNPLPGKIILLSPWLDISMTNPEMASFDKKDKMLGIEGLRLAGMAYAGGLDPKDYRLSPVYGDLSGLGNISVFTGTHDLLVTDARKLKNRAVQEHVPLHYYEYPGMFHVWMAVSCLKESKHAINQIADIVTN